MNKYIFTLLAVGACLVFAFQPIDKQAFVLNNMPAAKAKAAKEEKLLLVQFTARWCTPCQIMEQNTWTNPDLIAYMQENCIAGKVDIENFDGMSYTQEYRVRNVPTLLVFSSDGRQLGRYENSISATHLIQYLSQFNLPENRGGKAVAASGTPDLSQKPIETVATASTTYPDLVGPQPAPIQNRTLTAILEEYGLRKAEASRDTWYNGETALVKQQNSASAQEIGPKPVEPLPQRISTEYDVQALPTSTEQGNMAFVSKIIAPQTQPAQLALKPVATTRPVSVPKPTLVNPAQPEPDFMYTVQCGAYGTKAGADKVSKQVQSKMKTQTWVLIPEEIHDKLFRVITGTFYSREQANAYVKKIKGDGIDGFVRIMPANDNLALGN
jgi:thiol-disulfide isomerase/thioredoxin